LTTTTIDTDTTGSRTVITHPGGGRIGYLKVSPRIGGSGEVAVTKDNALDIIHALADAFDLDDHKKPEPSFGEQFDALAIGDQFTAVWANGTVTKGIKVDTDQWYSYSTNGLKSKGTLTEAWSGVKVISLTKNGG
jgi:hypothetical protein